MATQPFPDELGGKHDFDYITPRGRRLSEYEAVTCYTQPGVHGGGLQAPGDFMLRPDGRPLFDPNSTAVKCDDWYAFRDPNQLWQRGYYTMQAEAERSIDVATNVAIETGAVQGVDGGWIEQGLLRTYFPFSHYEYGLFRTLNVSAREALSDTINNVVAFNAADKLRHAQAITILGLDLEGAIDGFDPTIGRQTWLEADEWQPVRRVVEEAMALGDWVEAVVATNLVLEPLLGEPLRQQVFSNVAARSGDTFTPVITGTAMNDWLRNSRWAQAFVEFCATCPGGEGNAKLLQDWTDSWAEKVRPVSETLFSSIEASLGASGLVQQAQAVAKREFERLATALAPVAA